MTRHQPLAAATIQDLLDTLAPRLGLDVFACGRFADTRCELVLYAPALPPTLAKQVEIEIERIWVERMHEAQQTGGKLFDGPVLSYVTHRATGDSLWLGVRQSSYRRLVGTNFANGQRCIGDASGPTGPDRWPWSAYDNAVGTSVVLRTMDGHIVLGRRSQSVAFHAGYAHCAGGMLDHQDLAGTQINVFAGAARELVEELHVNVDVSDPDQLTCVALVRDREIWQPELVFEAVTTHSADTLRRMHEAAADQHEHVGVELLRFTPGDLVADIRSAVPIAPIGLISVLVVAAQHFGGDWLAEALRDLADDRRVPHGLAVGP